MAKLTVLILFAAMVQLALEGLPGLFTMATAGGNGETRAPDTLASHPPGPLLGWVDRTMGGAAWDVKPAGSTRQIVTPSR